MKFTVEVEDFYLETREDGQEGLEKGLKEYIKSEVYHKISEKIKKKVDESVRILVQERIEKELSSTINRRISELVSSEKIIKNKEEILISDYIKEQFSNNHGWNNPNDAIRKIAKEFGDEMKKRYDFIYANHIVQQMHTIGVIKEEIYNNLIENKEKIKP